MILSSCEIAMLPVGDETNCRWWWCCDGIWKLRIPDSGDVTQSMQGRADSNYGWARISPTRVVRRNRTIRLNSSSSCPFRSMIFSAGPISLHKGRQRRPPSRKCKISQFGLGPGPSWKNQDRGVRLIPSSGFYSYLPRNSRGRQDVGLGANVLG